MKIAILSLLLCLLTQFVQAQDTTTITVRLANETFELVSPDSITNISLDNKIFLVIENRTDDIQVSRSITYDAGEPTNENVELQVDKFDLTVPEDKGNVMSYKFAISGGDISQDFDIRTANQQVIGGNGSGNRNATECLTNGYYFIPDGNDYSKIKEYADVYRQQRIVSLTTVNKSKPHNVTLVYDWLTNKMTMNRPSNKKNSFFVKPRELISLQVININPYVHTVEVNDTVVNLHTEGQSEFEQQFTIAPPTPRDEGIALTQSMRDSSDELKLLERAACLRPELDIFYQRRLTDRAPDMDLLKAEIEAINEKIQTNLSIVPPVSTEKILEKATELLSKVTAANLGEEAMALARSFAEQTRKGAERHNNIANISYTARSAAVQPGDNDILRFTLKVREGQNEIVNKPYDVPIIGGWKADFSSGLFLTGLRNYKFATRDSTIITPVSIEQAMSADTTIKKVIFRQDEGDFDLGVGVMAHFYPRIHPGFNIGFSLGVITTADIEPRFLVGFNAIIGQNQRLIFNGGWAIGKVDRLSSDLRDNGFLESMSSVVPIREVRQVSWFFGITYNFTNTKNAANEAG